MHGLAYAERVYDVVVPLHCYLHEASESEVRPVVVVLQVDSDLSRLLQLLYQCVQPLLSGDELVRVAVEGPWVVRITEWEVIEM